MPIDLSKIGFTLGTDLDYDDIANLLDAMKLITTSVSKIPSDILQVDEHVLVYGLLPMAETLVAVLRMKKENLKEIYET